MSTPASPGDEVMMKRFLVVFLAAFLLTTLSGPTRAQAPSPGRDPKKLQVLILTGYNMHDWRKITESLRATLEATGRFEVRVNEEPVGCDEKTFEGYDAIVLNFTNHAGVFGPEWPDSTRRALLSVLERGKGVVAFHAALSSHPHWPEYEKLIGGAWRQGATHAPYHTFDVDLKEPEHPIVKGLPRSFLQHDEINQRLTMQPGITVLATAHDDPKNCSKGESPICGSGKDEPIMWTLPYRNGRVFTTTLGHDLRSVGTPGFIATFQRGVEWAATGKVTLPPPATLRSGD
ncbi:ThuA domain-containing protein [Singulisphaera acidiphila]|nr:ThuA domain-containing protein [Singulisphaera acidiphila]